MSVTHNRTLRFVAAALVLAAVVQLAATAPTATPKTGSTNSTASKGTQTNAADIDWKCDICTDYLEAGYLAGCDVGRFVSKICGPYMRECEAAFKILCDACKVVDCDSACEHQYACARLDMCPYPGKCPSVVTDN